MLNSLDTFVEIAKTKTPKKIAVAAAEDKTTLLALQKLTKQNLAEPVLIGDKEKITEICAEMNFNIDGYEIFDVAQKISAAKYAVQLVREGKADILTRGAIETADYLRPILNNDTGLKKARLVSQAAFVESPRYHKVFAFTDSGININPDVNDKAQMIKQCVEVFHRLGIQSPKVAVIAATEGVKTAMPSTIDAAILTQMCRRGGIKGCEIDGPLSIDLAFSKESVLHKGIQTNVGGDADLILLPEINSANAFYKTVTHLGGAKAASFIIGTISPVDFPSRSDSVETKYYAMVCAIAQCP
ncbi:phosphate acyltransferase [Klebsiella aerogenes]|uniref:phosphate acyltransferase n=1 Tax=Klebsiella aerogenes TaxID=548 RepID=UPI0021D2A8A5|nr:phosphate acyltransferase [Klebsiella aerogenes]MCU6317009.1 phosphate acetytransferase [Klebsiella aerogenes]